MKRRITPIIDHGCHCREHDCKTLSLRLWAQTLSLKKLVWVNIQLKQRLQKYEPITDLEVGLYPPGPVSTDDLGRDNYLDSLGVCFGETGVGDSMDAEINLERKVKVIETV